ncbi:MAG: SPOR domain-containing protein, partial [Deltaproteobacteria bacterium]|nr:SPOR domain-containing protein [Deltaproteobacteria bacterium]
TAAIKKTTPIRTPPMTAGVAVQGKTAKGTSAHRDEKEYSGPLQKAAALAPTEGGKTTEGKETGPSTLPAEKKALAVSQDTGIPVGTVATPKAATAPPRQELAGHEHAPTLAAAGERTSPSLKETLSLTAEKRPSPPPPSNGAGDYSIHVGSFKMQANAYALRDRLLQKGYLVSCHLTSIPGKGDWYRVKVGNYASREAALVVAAKLEAEEKVPALVLKKK